MNGGLAAWEAAGGPLNAGEAIVTPAAESYAGSPDEAALASLELVAASLNNPLVALVDARTAEEDAAGHIPGAVNVDFPLNAEPDPPKVWKPAEELSAIYGDLG